MKTLTGTPLSRVGDNSPALPPKGVPQGPKAVPDLPRNPIAHQEGRFQGAVAQDYPSNSLEEPLDLFPGKKTIQKGAPGPPALNPPPGEKIPTGGGKGIEQPLQKSPDRLHPAQGEEGGQEGNNLPILGPVIVMDKREGIG